MQYARRNFTQQLALRAQRDRKQMKIKESAREISTPVNVRDASGEKCLQLVSLYSAEDNLVQQSRRAVIVLRVLVPLYKESTNRAYIHGADVYVSAIPYIAHRPDAELRI